MGSMTSKSLISNCDISPYYVMMWWVQVANRHSAYYKMASGIHKFKVGDKHFPPQNQTAKDLVINLVNSGHMPNGERAPRIDGIEFNKTVLRGELMLTQISFPEYQDVLTYTFIFWYHGHGV